MSMNLVTTLYLIASICFIQALKGLSHPTTSRRGNLFGMIGMAFTALSYAEIQNRSRLAGQDSLFGESSEPGVKPAMAISCSGE